MLVFRALHFIMGYVVFCARGGFPERFLNLCAGMKIPVWEIYCKSGAVCASTTAEGYKAMHEAARRSGMRLRVTARRGVPFFLHAHRRRAGLAVGLVFLICFILALSTRLWTVEVVGNERVSDSSIVKVLDTLGVRAGVRRSKVDASEVSAAALKKLPGLAWISVNIEGSRAVAQVREISAAPGIEDQNRYCNLVASADGQIITFEPYEGDASARVGDAVLKGDLLVSGVTQNKDGSVKLRHAMGYVTARTRKKITAMSQNDIAVKIYTKTRKRLTIGFFGISLPFGRLEAGKNSRYFENRRDLVLLDTVLPFSVTVRSIHEFDAGKAKRTQSALRLSAAAELLEREARELRWCDTLEIVAAVEKTQTGFTARGEYVCLENIGEQRPIAAENTVEEELP